MKRYHSKDNYPIKRRRAPKVSVADTTTCLRCDGTFNRRIPGDKTERICQRCKKGESDWPTLHHWDAWGGEDGVF